MFYMIFSSAIISKAEKDRDAVTRVSEIVDSKDIEKESSLKERKNKKKKGERNVKVQPNQEDDENIILELDEN